jgi:hypothetical protein
MSAVVPFEPRKACTDADLLGAEITELCSYICAATCHLLDLIREFDERQYWAEQGFHSCAHWLNFHCGIGKNAAREKIRVAHALGDRPRIHAALAEGRVSYSKVRAITRIADASNEDYLLNLCEHGTAHHVERVVAQYRRARKFADRDLAIDQYERREVTYYYDTDGSIVVKAKLPPDRGEVVLKALDKAINVSGEAPVAQRRADALSDVAETYLSNSNYNGATADRFQVVVHTRPGSDTEIECGPNVSAVTSERIACDCSRVDIEECEHGEPLSIGRKSRVIPPAIYRVLKARDGGCRFPGCTHERFVDGHHIQHWSKGGETSLENLVLLCRHHHVLVHEGGFDCRRSDSGEIYFLDQRGRLLATNPTPQDVTLEESLAHLYRKFPQTAADGCRARWHAGEKMDFDYAVSVLFPTDQGVTAVTSVAGIHPEPDSRAADFEV